MRQEQEKVLWHSSTQFCCWHSGVVTGSVCGAMPAKCALDRAPLEPGSAGRRRSDDQRRSDDRKSTSPIHTWPDDMHGM